MKVKLDRPIPKDIEVVLDADVFNFVAVGDNILVRPEEKPEYTPGGIALPEVAQQSKVLTGEVVGVGPGKASMTGQLVPSTIQFGDVVTYDRYGATPIEVNGLTLHAVKEQHVFLRKPRVNE